MELRRQIAAAALSFAAAAALAAQAGQAPQTFGTQVAYYRIDASELSQFSTVNQYGNAGVLRYAQTTPGFGMVAPVHLPSGAAVVSVELDYYDVSPTGSAIVALAQCENAAGACGAFFTGDGCVDGGATACSGAAPAPGFGSAVGTLSGVTIDNVAHQYVVAAATSTLDGSTAISAVRIGYVLQVSPAPAGATFGDVPTSHPFFQFVEALAASGITGGCGGGNYCPDAPLTRGQMAVFLAKALGLQWN